MKWAGAVLALLETFFNWISIRRRSCSWLEMSEIDAIISDTFLEACRVYTIMKQIVNSIRGLGRGSVCTPRQFLDLGSRAAVDQALSRLVRRGILQRIGRGLYHYPKHSPRLGDLAPAPDAVARAYARKTGSTLQVSGAQAANALGLSTQVPARVTFVTDGATRQLRVGNQVVFLRRAAPRRLLGAGTAWGTALQALAYLGKGGVDTTVIQRLRRALPAADRRALGRHAGLAPDWMRPVIAQLAGKP